MPIYKAKGKKDGLQRYRVKVNYTDQHGEARQIERVAYGYDQAKAVERTLVIEVKEMPQTADITVKELYDRYVAAKKHEVRETTMSKAKQILNSHVLPYLEEKKLSKLNVQVLEDWKLKIEKKNLSLTMRKNIYTAFRTMLGYAIKMEYLSQNPLLKVGNFKDAYATKEKVDFYTADEFKKFKAIAFQEAAAHGFYEYNYAVFFSIAFYTGLRKGEIYALKWTDIEGNILHVCRSVAQQLKGDDRETPPKNQSSIRDLQIPEPLAVILKDHHARYASTNGFTDDWRICGGPQVLRNTTVTNRNKAYAKLAGIKAIRLHDFRHSHASLLANEGINIQEIARRLGHSKIEITWNTYSHLYPREEERAVSVLNKIK
ncbi:MAG: site-specific integrase [Clostridia bacterium]|nr:site-specific integrase [Clostridia bacterium]